MTATPIPTMVQAMAGTAGRQHAALALARRLGVDELLVLVRDPELGTRLPAPGFPSPTHDAPAWRSFLAATDEAPGLHRGALPLHPDAPPTPITTIGDDGVTLVLLGGPPDDSELAALLPCLPLLGALVRAELTAATATRDLERSDHACAALRDELQTSRRRKDEFLAMLGHELRNPIAAITGALELMRVSHDVLEVLARARAVIERQSQQLAHFVDDLLDASRVTRGKISLRRETLDVDEVVRRAVESTHLLVVARKHRLHVRYAGSLLAIADPTRLEQMVANLLRNAARYTDVGGEITITVTREGEHAVVRVQDTGIGIVPEQLGTIFEPFMQVASTLDRSQGGMGVGLTLVKELAALHDGSIDVTSEPGRGSIFTLRIPALPVGEGTLPHPGPAVSTLRERRVLVVDDNIDAAEVLVELLDMWGHTALHAADGPQALALAPEFAPDLILLDIGLPVLDGYAVARLMREDPRLDDARIIAMTGYGQIEDRARTAQAGFAAHLVKPVDFEELRHVLREPA